MKKLSPFCLLFTTPWGVFLPRFPHHSPASSCLFLQGCREKLTSWKMLAVWKDAFRRPLLKLMYTDSGCHRQCCGVYGFVVCCSFWNFCLFVCLFLFRTQWLPCRHFTIWNFSFIINITVAM